MQDPAAARKKHTSDICSRAGGPHAASGLEWAFLRRAELNTSAEVRMVYSARTDNRNAGWQYFL